jgi:hypothetical protein
MDYLTVMYTHVLNKDPHNIRHQWRDARHTSINMDVLFAHKHKQIVLCVYLPIIKILFPSAWDIVTGYHHDCGFLSYICLWSIWGEWHPLDVESYLPSGPHNTPGHITNEMTSMVQTSNGAYQIGSNIIDFTTIVQ